ncbi:hypothetical protein J8L98_03165 [Pseudoalteromonas sp. MMG013]|uniref:hypothetical protein n=1 Tax=Pseudoalteromonas sp. MMG013 TaxID=2822687 RepID=UPI001B3703FE|nr:hypothetical protein [Pseudoalteromonas sp. MMG013]MBQ4860696.1 hypothetical protein [Pseudoalteromonas sp. MMG013]
MGIQEQASNKLIIRDGNTWSALWPKIVAEYWTNPEKYTNTDNKLYSLLKALNVENIELTNDGSVAFLAYKKRSQEDNVPYIIKVSLTKSNSSNYNREYAFQSTNGWQDIAVGLVIKLPPHISQLDDSQGAKILANYSDLSLYFPFAEDFNSSYFDTEFVSQNIVKNEPSVVYEKNRTFSIENSNSKNLLQKGDRGGSTGLDDDYCWMHFIPRLVALNWSLSSKEALIDGSKLCDYPHILSQLNYKIPNGLNVYISYANTESISSEGEIDNINSYTSTLLLDLPEKVSTQSDNLNPMALADLIAIRANQPFTST